MLALLRLYASPDPLATSSALMHRVHDHHQTQADKEGNLTKLSIHTTACTLAPATFANWSHNSRVPRVHPPSRATTQEMPFLAITQEIRSEPQLKEHQQADLRDIIKAL
ncbi:hypothetical protein DEO72_LG3g1281 [Vigna unguiculata]|uniref:Uncharacterized protein n=1 Tax=Vigna unguiculata TaxID=3917 RepID=A0A4D6LEK3_VIGUN|nr:hypothetical protein DEO72_LG3g1281 [Vigna unguiculata]